MFKKSFTLLLVALMILMGIPSYAITSPAAESVATGDAIMERNVSEKTRVSYIFPANNETSFNGEEPIVIRFTAPIPTEEIRRKVTVIDLSAGAAAVPGIWTASEDNTVFQFVSYEYLSGHSYLLQIPETVLDNRGEAILASESTTFRSVADCRLEAAKDTYVAIGSDEPAGTALFLHLFGDDSKGYLEFDISNVKEDAVKARLTLSVENNAINTVWVYALDEGATWSEETLVYGNAPEETQLLGSLAVLGAGVYTMDISEYVKSLNGNTVRLVLINQIDTAEAVYEQRFDDLSRFVRGSGTNGGSYSDTYDFCVGGSPISVSLSDAQADNGVSGKSLRFVTGGNRDSLKLYNAIKSSALTEKDIGKTYHISFWVKSDAKTEVTAGLAAPSGTFCGATSSTAVPANTWVQGKLTYTLTAENVDSQAAMLTFSAADPCELYIDDILVEQEGTEVIITSREGKDIGHPAPALLVNVTHGDAQIGDKEYQTVEEALAAAPENGTETVIRVRNDVTVPNLNIATGKNVVLDLGGHVLQIANADNEIRGRLCVDNGTLQIGSADGWGFRVWDGGSKSKAHLEFLDNVIVISDAKEGLVQVGDPNRNPGEVIFAEGVTVFAEGFLVYAYDNSPVTVLGGRYDMHTQSAVFCFIGNAERKIMGGSFSRVGDSPAGVLFATVDAPVIFGGTYWEKPDQAVIAQGYYTKENDGGTYTVEPYGAKLGETYYAAFEDAVDAVPAEGESVIMLLKDACLARPVVFAEGSTVTVDLCGHTLICDSVEWAEESSAPILVRGALKLRNGTLKVADPHEDAYAIHIYGSKLSEPASLTLMDDFSLVSEAAGGAIRIGKNASLPGILTVHDGVSVTTVRYLVFCYNNSTFTILGGTFEDTAQTALFYTEGANEKVIRGGVFRSKGNFLNGKRLFHESQGVVLMGGVFSEEPKNSNSTPVSIAEGHTLAENGDGTYTVCRDRQVCEPIAEATVSQAKPDTNFGKVVDLVLSGQNRRNNMIVASFNTNEVMGHDYLQIPVTGLADGQKISIAVVDGWTVDESTVTYNIVQNKLMEEQRKLSRSDAKFVGRYTLSSEAFEIDVSALRGLVEKETFTLVLQADEEYLFVDSFEGYLEAPIEEGARDGFILAGNTLNFPYTSDYVVSRGGSGGTVAIVRHPDKDGKDSQMFRVQTTGTARYKFFNAFTEDALTLLDIGRTFRVSFDVMTEVDVGNNFFVSLQSCADGDGVTSPTAYPENGLGGEWEHYAANLRYREYAIKTTAKEWKTVTFDVTVDQTMVLHQIAMLAFSFPAKGVGNYFYIDNIKVQEIGGNAGVTVSEIASRESAGCMMLVDYRQIEFRDNVAVVEMTVSMDALDKKETVTHLIAHGDSKNVILAVNNKTGVLFLRKNGKDYPLCDVIGKPYSVASGPASVVVILDKAAGTARYAIGDVLANVLMGETVKNTYGNVMEHDGFVERLRIGTICDDFEGAVISEFSVKYASSDLPEVLGAQVNIKGNTARILAGIDLLYYTKIGFIAVRGDGATKIWNTTSVFSAVSAQDTLVTAESMGCNYLSGFLVTGIDKASDGDTFTVTPTVYIGTEMVRGKSVTYRVVKNGNTTRLEAVKK